MDAFNMYSMFWAINGFLGSEKSLKTGRTEKNKMSKLSTKLKGLLDCCKE